MRPTSLTFPLVACLSLSLAALIACSEPADATAPAAPAEQGDAVSEGAGAAAADGNAGASTTIDSDLPPPTFLLSAPDAGVAPWAGTATLTVIEAHVENGSTVPETASISVGGTSQTSGAQTSYGAGFRYDLTPSDLLAQTTFSVPANLPASGFAPVGVAAAVGLPTEADNQVLDNGHLDLELGTGTLSGTLITNTSVGTVSFGGRYSVLCFATTRTAPVADGAIDVPTDTLVNDSHFASPFCQRFRGLVVDSLSESKF
jgi:hypothetical protein